jgi:hypothetical protein
MERTLANNLTIFNSQLIMNIIATIQNHFQQQRSVSIPVPMEIACKTFDKFSRTDIIHGNKFNPFSNYYTFKVRWDGNTALLDGPFKIKTMPLSTFVVLHRGIGNTYTTLDLKMKVSRQNVAITLLLSALMNLLYAGTVIFSLLPIFSILIVPTIILSLAYWFLLYGLAWLNVVYSSNMIVECLPLNFSMVSGEN